MIQLQFQGIEFTSEYQLARELYSKIEKYEKATTKNKEIAEKAIAEETKSSYEKTTAIPNFKSDVDSLQEKKDTLPPKRTMAAIGDGVQLKPSEKNLTAYLHLPKHVPHYSLV
jgi:hypothetical protein